MNYLGTSITRHWGTVFAYFAACSECANSSTQVFHKPTEKKNERRKKKRKSSNTKEIPSAPTTPRPHFTKYSSLSSFTSRFTARLLLLLLLLFQYPPPTLPPFLPPSLPPSFYTCFNAPLNVLIALLLPSGIINKTTPFSGPIYGRSQM